MVNPLQITDLFTPAPSGVGLNIATPPPGSWLASMLKVATVLGLPTTSWQPGAPERTIFSMDAAMKSMTDAIISLMAQGGFLDFAAAGTVSYTAIDGTITTSYVTPDPSIASQNPDGSPGWLDALGQSFYNVPRIQATSAAGPLAIANTTNGTLSYAIGLYHVANTNTGATYSNTVALSIPPSRIAGGGGTVTSVAAGGSTSVSTTSAHGLASGNTVYFNGVVGINGINGFFAQVASVPTSNTFTISLLTSGSYVSGGNVYLCTTSNFAADVIGIPSNAAPGEVTSAVTQNVGVFIDNLGAWSAANYESNAAYAARIRLSLAALSPNGPANAYEYFALSAQQILASQVPPINISPISQANAFSNPATGVVTTYVAAQSPISTVQGHPVTEGCSQLGILHATEDAPILIVTVSPHGLATGDTVTISGAQGNTAANGTWSINVIGSVEFTMNNSVGNAPYSGGGTVDGGTLGQVDALIQANVVPDGIVQAITQSALAFPITVVATVVIPRAYFSLYQTAAPAALIALLASLPIGGNEDTAPTSPTFGQFVVPYSAIEGALSNAGVLTVGANSYVREIASLTVNGGTVNAVYPANNYIALLVTPTINLVGV